MREKSEKIKAKMPRPGHNGLVLLAIRIAADDFFCIVHIRRTTKAYNDTKTTRYCPDFISFFSLFIRPALVRPTRRKMCARIVCKAFKESGGMGWQVQLQAIGERE